MSPSVTQLPAHCELVEHADGTREIRHRDAGVRWFVAVTALACLLLSKGLLLGATVSGDGWAALFLVLTPLVLGGLWGGLARALGARDV